MTTKKHVSLKSAAEDKSMIGVTKSLPTFMVDPRMIVVVPGFNGRPIDPVQVQQMKQAWRAGKARVPAYNPLPEMILRVVDGALTLVAGQHRLTAYLELIAEGEDIARVPCKEFKGSDKEAILCSLAENSGKPWEMAQLGEKYAVLVNSCGMSYAEVAAERGMSPQHVKDCIRLIEQPAELKEAVSAGEISASQAMKLVKSTGSGEKAAEVIKSARGHAATSGVKAGKITQKVLDKAGRSVMDERANNAKQAKLHMQAMLESPTFNREQKDAMRIVIKAIGGRVPAEIAESKPIDTVSEFLREMALNTNDMVRNSGELLIKYRNKQFIPSNNSEQAQYYGHMCWLQDMAAKQTNRKRAMAAHWFLAAFDATRAGRDDEIAPPPELLTMDAAVRMERDSDGAVDAESMCPEHAGLIGWLRRGGK